MDDCEFLDQVRLADPPVPAERAARAVLGTLGDHLPPGTAGYLASSLPPAVAAWLGRRSEGAGPDQSPTELVAHEVGQRCGCPDEAAPGAVRAVVAALSRAVPGGVMYKVRVNAPSGVAWMLNDDGPAAAADTRGAGVAAGRAG